MRRYKSTKLLIQSKIGTSVQQKFNKSKIQNNIVLETSKRQRSNMAQINKDTIDFLVTSKITQQKHQQQALKQLEMHSQNSSLYQQQQQPQEVSYERQQKQRMQKNVPLIEGEQREEGDLQIKFAYFSQNCRYDIEPDVQGNKKNLKKGKFNINQQQILSNTVGEFLVTHEITYDQFIIILNEKNIINNLLKKLQFYKILNKALPQRSAQSCYRFIKRNFNNQNHHGKWTEEQEEKLLKLVETYRKKWTLISKEIGRTSDNVYDKYRSIGEENAPNRNKQAWTIRQLIRLLKLIQQKTKSSFLLSTINNQLPFEGSHDALDRLDQHKSKYNTINFQSHNIDILLKYISPTIKQINVDHISWSSIAKKVRSRSFSDCKNKFLGVMEVIFKIYKFNNLKLITFLQDQKVLQEKEIDWQLWEQSETKPFQLKNRYSTLKKSISHKSTKDFPQILHEIKLKLYSKTKQT